MGLMVREPVLRVRVTAASAFSTTATAAIEPAGAIERVRKVATALVAVGLLADTPACAIDVCEMPPSHAGLGTGTQLALAAAVGMLELAGVARPPIERIAACVGRGKRSSVGLHGFQHGGLIVEAGKFAPTTKSAPIEIGPLVARAELPSDWRFVLLTPRGKEGLSGDAERLAFQTLPAVLRDVTDRLCGEVLLRLVPAAREGRFAEFSDALYRIGLVAGECFSPVQGGPYASRELAAIVQHARRQGVGGIAQSSWGPTLFAVLPDAKAASEFATAMRDQFACDTIITSAQNVGAQVSHDDPSDAS